MGGPAEFRATHDSTRHAEHAFDRAQAHLLRLEQRYSRFLDDSLVSRINRAAGTDTLTSVDHETAGLLNYAATLWQESGGLFDITSGVMRRAWRWDSDSPPGQQEINACLELIGWDKVQWDGERIGLRLPGMELDFGGLVKEYAADAAAATLREAGLNHALVNLAGDIAVTGPQAPGRAWHTGISNPENPDVAMATVAISGGGLATSGDYQRYIEIEGERLSHLINPKTGWPARGLASVSVLADQCLIAGSSATLAILMEREAGLAWLGSAGLSWLAIDTAGGVHGTIAHSDTDTDTDAHSNTHSDPGSAKLSSST